MFQSDMDVNMFQDEIMSCSGYVGGLKVVCA
jgi:hypothetical protein